MSELKRARRVLARTGAWIEAQGAAYVVRATATRRARPLARLDETGFRALIASPGLSPRPGGGWTARTERPEGADQAGRPGSVEGTRVLMEADGRTVTRRANLAQSAVAWLAARRDPDGRPWLDAAQAAAAERLAADAEIALKGPSLTMRWDALPRSGSGSAARVEPGDRAMAAARRIEAALAACGPARGVVEAICLRSTALQAAERDLGLKRRDGKRLLAEGLTALAAHYRIG